MTATAGAPIPQRVQRRRTKGWRKPPGAVSVVRPSRWGNPFVVQQIVQIIARGRQQPVAAYDRSGAVRLYRRWLDGQIEVVGQQAPTRDAIRQALAGRDLMCYCPLGDPCHADVLLAIANEER